VLTPRWLAKAPAPDPVVLCFGGNGWDAGMRGPQFREAYRDAVDRVRRATKDRADVLILTTVPAAARWGTTADLAEACRKAAADCKAGLGDAEKAFLAAGDDEKERERLYVKDRTHLAPAGHGLMAHTVLAAVEAAAK